MVVATHPNARMTEEEYLARERDAEYKSEYVEGEVYAMSGGSLRHSYLQSAIYREIGSQLLKKGCMVLTSDVKVRAPRKRSYLYPDASIVCGKPATFDGNSHVLVNPIVLIEVLSPSTEQYDRSKKFVLYREIESLMDYVLVDWREPLVEHFTRQPEGKWLLAEYRGSEASFEISSVGCHFRLAEVYAGAMDVPA